MITRFPRGIAAVCAFAVICATTRLASAQLGATSGTLYYTTYDDPSSGTAGTANSVPFSFTGNTFTLGTPVQIHNFGSEGVDAFSFLPNTNLLIGGKDGTVHNIKQDGALTGNVSTGGAPGFHVSLSLDGKTAYTAGIPGFLSTIPTSPFGAGTMHPLGGDDTEITSVAFDDGGHAFYTSSGAKGNGNFGTIDLNSFTTHRTISDLPAAHGLTFDQFSQMLILAGSNHISQILPGDPKSVFSDYQTDLGDNPGSDRFDQVVTDGNGRLFATVNDGTLLFMNYNFTGQVGGSSNFVKTQFVQQFLTGVGLPPDSFGRAIPLPAAIWPAAMMLAGMGAFKLKRRRGATDRSTT